MFMFFLSHTFIYLLFFCSDRIIFAVKEASLLDQGSQGKQSIYQLEHVKRMSYFEEMLIKYGLIFLIFVINFFELFFLYITITLKSTAYMGIAVKSNCSSILVVLWDFFF